MRFRWNLTDTLTLITTFFAKLPRSGDSEGLFGFRVKLPSSAHFSTKQGEGFTLSL